MVKNYKTLGRPSHGGGAANYTACHEEPLSLALGAAFAAYAPPVRRFNPIAENTKVWVAQPRSRSVVAKKTGQGKYGWDHGPELEASSQKSNTYIK